MFERRQASNKNNAQGKIGIFKRTKKYPASGI
jgi:hypothetical protein